MVLVEQLSPGGPAAVAACGGSKTSAAERIDIGVDLNGDKMLESSEITQTVYVCGGCLGSSNLGQPCGACGGTVQCEGTCSVTTPANFGASCGSCGGAIQCDGSCSVPTPANFGANCTLFPSPVICGAVGCDGTCDLPLSAGLAGQSCPCGGTESCSGTCPGVPADYGTSCSGGAVQCDGTCGAPSGCFPFDDVGQSGCALSFQSPSPVPWAFER